MQTAKVLSDPRPGKIRIAALIEFESRLLSAIQEGFHQEPFLSVTDWAAQHRFLTGAESGRYNPSRCPYQQAIQDRYNDPEVREITWMSAERRQIGRRREHPGLHHRPRTMQRALDDAESRGRG
jgi:hypothetical protein